MERIAPLAKILAEANGIDWRNLPGSGEGGMIVEQDILNYLTRVMSGEEEPPSTPVDAPPPEWTGTELPAGAGLFGPGMPSMDMLSSAGVDSDLAALVGQPQPVQPQPVQPQPVQPLAAAPDDELEFELEDDQPEEVMVAAQPVSVPPAFPAEVAPVPFAASAPEVAPAEQAPGLAASAQPELVSARAETAPAAAPAGGVLGGLGNLLSRLYQPAAQPAPVPSAPVAETPVPQPPVTEAPAPAAELDEPAPQPPVFTEPEAAPRVAAEQVAEERVAAEQMPQAEEQVAGEQTAEPAPTPSEPEVAPVAVPTSAPAPAPSREAVWFGAYLRRDTNLAPAADLRRQLVAALGQDVPLALLVARAAQRHADSLGLNTVAVQDLDAGRAQPVQPGGLRDALAALGTDHAGTPDLLVIDASALDLDDLHLPHTVTLSVGRVQEGRAALTLQGDVDPAQAARFLANVAGTLEEPIILVV